MQDYKYVRYRMRIGINLGIFRLKDLYRFTNFETQF